MVYKIPPGGGGKPYLASGLFIKIVETMLNLTTRKVSFNIGVIIYIIVAPRLTIVVVVRQQPA